MNYKQIFLGIFICIFLEFVIYKINHKYHFFKPIFETTISITSSSTSSVFSEMHEGGGRFTNPLLECVTSEDESPLSQFSISKTEINNFVNSILNQNKVDFISVYIRDLNNGPWMGINTKEEFIGGSLLKVPVLISYLKLSEDDKSILNKKIKFTEKIPDFVQYFGSSKQIELGKTYTVNELLEYMIYNSDNNAMQLLVDNLKINDLNDTFESLGFGRPDVSKPYPVNVVTYAGFFRVLFNSSYLSKPNSEKALGMLSKTDFNNGITEQLPNNITVSHKYGIRTIGGVNQLHDCGIVYYPKHPYLLCVMSKGGSFDNLSKSIADISKFVYDQISNSLSKTQ